MSHPNPSDDSGDPSWTLPLHGIEVPGDGGPPSAADPGPGPYLNPDEDVPPLDFQPRLSRFGEAA